MGGRFCTINSPRGSRWGQKSRDRRSSDFCRHCGPSGELTVQYQPLISFCLYPTLYMCIFFVVVRSLTVLQKSKRRHLCSIKSPSAQLKLSVRWGHNIYLWRHNGVRRHPRAKHYEYFVFESWTQTVYWPKNPVEPLYIYSWWNDLALNRAIFLKLSYISKLVN